MTIQIKKLTETQIANLEDKGARRWTKYGKDRIYLSDLDKTFVGLDIDYYKTGNVCCAKLNGEEISNSKANDILASLKSGYIDLTTDELVLVCYRRSEEFEIFAENLVKAIETKVEESAAEENKEVEEPTAEKSEKEIIEEKVNADSDITYKYSEKTGFLSVKDYHGQSEIVTIPSEVCGYKVYKISYCAFDKNSIVKEVVISDGIKKIFGAFREMSSLETVSILGDVEKIDSSAFSDCPNLKKINASEKVIEMLNH